jgi:apolipoprotein N-acyltransferase
MAPPERGDQRVISKGFIVLCGVLGAQGFAPRNYWWAFLLAMIIMWHLVIPLKQSEIRHKKGLWSNLWGQGFLKGWLFGLGLFASSLFWIRNALWVDGERFLWLWPFCVLGIPCVLGVFTGLWAAFTAVSQNFFGFHGKNTQALLLRILWGSTLWSLLEYARSTLFTGFPWNLTAYIWADVLPFAQSVSVIGSYGLGFLTVLLAGLLWAFLFSFLSFFRNKQNPYGILNPTKHFTQNLKNQAFPRPLSYGISCILCCTLILSTGSLFWWGKNRLDRHPIEVHPHILLRLVQPNITQEIKNDYKAASFQLIRLFDLTHEEPQSNEKVTHVIWPESAFPYIFIPEILKSHLKRFVKTPGNVPLIMGAVRRTFSKDNPYQIFNSIVVLHKEKVLWNYDKIHLVPFGEYIPCRSLLEKALPSDWLKKMTPGDTDFNAGNTRSALAIPGLPRGIPFICYEMIFPHTLRVEKKESFCRWSKEILQNLRGDFAVKKHSGSSGQWMLCITNDGWFGTSDGPHQHFISSAFRTIEEGIPLVRVANTGVTAVVDPVGRVLRAPMYRPCFLDAPLPLALKKITWYGRYGNLLFFGMLLLLWMVIVVFLTPYISFFKTQKLPLIKKNKQP